MDTKLGEIKMSNLYKGLLEQLTARSPYFDEASKLRRCFYCQNKEGEVHKLGCFYIKVKIFLDLNLDIKEKKPWTLCPEMPTEGDWYLVTLENNGKRWVEYLNYTWFGSTYKYLFQRDTGIPIDAKIIAWMPKPKPYQPPEKETAELDTKIVNPADPLNGWIPVWREKPDNDRDVKLLLLSDGIAREAKGWLCNRREWYIYYNMVSLEFEALNPDDEVLAWKELESYPDPELFKNPKKTTTKPSTDDPLMGWIPVWQDLPKNHYVKLLLIINELMFLTREPQVRSGFYNKYNKSWTICNEGSSPMYLTIPISSEEVLAWMYQPAIPNIEILKKQNMELEDE